MQAYNAYKFLYDSANADFEADSEKIKAQLDL
jgi:hypothetical protein